MIIQNVQIRFKSNSDPNSNKKTLNTQPSFYHFSFLSGQPTYHLPSQPPPLQPNTPDDTEHSTIKPAPQINSELSELLNDLTDPEYFDSFWEELTSYQRPKELKHATRDIKLFRKALKSGEIGLIDFLIKPDIAINFYSRLADACNQEANERLAKCRKYRTLYRLRESVKEFQQTTAVCNFSISAAKHIKKDPALRKALIKLKQHPNNIEAFEAILEEYLKAPLPKAYFSDHRYLTFEGNKRKVSLNQYFKAIGLCILYTGAACATGSLGLLPLASDFYHLTLNKVLFNKLKKVFKIPTNENKEIEPVLQISNIVHFGERVTSLFHRFIPGLGQLTGALSGGIGFGLPSLSMLWGFQHYCASGKAPNWYGPLGKIANFATVMLDTFQSGAQDFLQNLFDIDLRGFIS